MQHIREGWQRWRARRRQQAVEQLQHDVGLRLNQAVETQEWLDVQFKPWLEAELTPYMLQMIRSSQHLHAMQFVLDNLVVTHPNPERLLRNWRLNVTHATDALIDERPPRGQEELKQEVLDAWQEVILHFTQLIEGVVETSGRGDGQTDQ